MAKYVCAEPGCPALLPKAGRCPRHRRESPTYLRRDWRERKRRAAAVRAHRARYGDWCPGYEVPAHVSFDLTADHVTPVASGGIDGPLVVLCRSCNSRKSSHE